MEQLERSHTLLEGVQISTTSENWQHLLKLNTWIHYDPEIPFLGICLTAMHICVHIKFHGSSSHGNKQIKTIQSPSTLDWMNYRIL